MSELTVSQWLFVWISGLVLAHFATAWKDGMDGLVGVVVYLLVSFFAVVVLALYEIFTALGS